MKVLVTGGAGFIGSHVVDLLLAEGHEAVVFDDLSMGRRSYVAAGARFVMGSIVDRPAVEKAMAGIDFVMHLAAQRSVVASMANPIRDAEINVIGTLNLLEAAAQQGVKSFVFAGTGGALYGETEDRPTPETHAAEPESPYGISKLTGERYIAHFGKRFEMCSTVLRLANVYGPRQDSGGEGGVVAIFCRQIQRGESVKIFGSGEQTRDYVYVGDVARAFVDAAGQSVSGVFNIGSGVETSVNALVAAIGEAVQSEPVIEYSAARAGEILWSSLDPSAARQGLGWEPKTSLIDGLRETANYFAPKAAPVS